MKRKSNDNLIFGQRLQRLRQKARLSPLEIAKAIGVATSTYRDWEQGRAVTGQPYQNLAKVLGIGVYELLGLEERGKQEVSERLIQVEELVRDIRENL